MRYLIPVLLMLSACDQRPLPECYSLPLQKAHITIPLGGGLATAIDDKLLPVGKSVEMENCRQGRLGEVIPRVGTTALGLGILGNAATLPPPWAMGTFKGALVSLSQIGDYPLATWSPTTGQWTSGGQSSTAFLNGQSDIRTARRGPIFARGDRITGEGTAPDIAYASGFYFVIYQYLPPGAIIPNVYQRILDATTGRVVAERITTPGALGYLTGVRVTASGYAVFCYSDAMTTGFIFDVWHISNLDAGPTTYTAPALGLGITIRTAFDMLSVGAGTVSAIYYHVGTNAIRGIDIVAATGATTGWILNDATAATVPLGSWNWVKDLGGSGIIGIATYSVAQGVRVQWNIPTAGSPRQAAATIPIDAAPGIVSNIVAATIGTQIQGTMVVLYDNIAIATPTSITKIGYVDTGVPSGNVTHRSITLRSKVWKQGSDFYVTTEMPSLTQNTRFVMRLDPPQVLVSAFPAMFPVAKAQLNNGVLLSMSGGAVSDVVSSGTGVWVSANTTTTRISGQPTAYGATYSGIELLSTRYLAPGDVTAGNPREAVDSAFVPSGMLGVFDGVSYLSADFAAYPEIPAFNIGAAAPASPMGTGTYYYKATYARTDASGRTWRSAPSIIRSVAVAANTVTVIVPTLRVVDTLSSSTQSLDGYFVELWRGDVNDNNTFKLVGIKPNNAAADSVTFTDNQADTAIDANEFLYTNGGGIAPNDAVPGFTAIAISDNRVWGAYKNELWMSNQFIPGRGLLWSEGNKIILNDQHGDITGIAAQPNGVLLVFKADAVYGVAGPGPDQAGRGGFQTQFVAIGMGTVNPRSIVETSVGTEFQSTGTRHGWFRINLGLTPEYIGGAVERYTTSVVVGAILLPNSNETRYYLASGGSLIHDYVTDLWGIDTGPAAATVCATAWGSLGVSATSVPVITADLTVITGFSYGQNMNMKVTTPWIKLADLKGFERFYRVQGVGELGDDDRNGSSTIAMYANMDTSAPVFTQNISIGHLWNWECRYSAKLESVRFTISSLIGDEDNPALVKWTALVIEYGTHSSMRHQPAGNRTT